MLSSIRGTAGKYFVYAIITLISAVFVFYGVFSPKATRGLHEGAVAGEVNGEAITLAEFNREYNRRVEFFKNMAGGKFTEDQMKAFRIKEGVFMELARRKLMLQEAQKQGLTPSDEEIREKIAEMPYFQKDGKFDYDTYKATLAANQYSPGTFERLVREDLSAGRWQDYFRERVHFSSDEVKDSFMTSQDKRNIKYVMITPDAARKALKIDDAEVAKYIADPAKANLLKSRYEAKKEEEFKGKMFDQVKSQLARDALAGEKIQEIQKLSAKIADDIAPLMKADKASDAKVNAALKPYGLEVKSTGLIPLGEGYLPGIGEARDLTKDAFAAKSPIDPAQGGQAKKYALGTGNVVALVTESQKPDLSKLEGERDRLIRQIVSKKEKALMDEWMQGLTKKAKIIPNASVVGDAGPEAEG